MSVVTCGGLLRDRGCFGQLACFETVGMPLLPVFGKFAFLDTVGIPTGLVSSGSGDGGLEEDKFGGGRCIGLWSSELEL